MLRNSDFIFLKKIGSEKGDLDNYFNKLFLLFFLKILLNYKKSSKFKLIYNIINI